MPHTRPGVVVVEGPMGCGKTEAALFAALQRIVSGHQQGMYFALPTQVMSHRIHKRIERFLRNTLADDNDLDFYSAVDARKPKDDERWCRNDPQTHIPSQERSNNTSRS